MRFHDAPIQRKLMTVLLLTSGVVLFVTCAAFVTYEVISLRQNLVRGYTVRAEIIAANSTAALAFANEADAENVLSALKGDPRMLAACLYDVDGAVFARYPATVARESFPAAPLQSGHHFAPGQLEIFSPVVQGDRTLGTVYLRTDLSILTERIVALAWLALLVLGGSLLLAYVISKFLQKQISAPILALASTARAVSNQRDYSVRARKQGDDELGLLTDAFNQMLTEIDVQNQALSESEARTRAVLNSALSAVVVMDSRGAIIDWNARAETLFGWPRGEAIGRDLAEAIIPTRHREAHRRGMERFLQTGEGPVLNQLIEMTALNRDGREFPVEMSISPLKAGNTVSFCGFVTDITERKRAAQQTEVFAGLGHSLSAAASADAAARAIVQAADVLLGWDSCSVDSYQAKSGLVFPVLNIDTIDGQRTDVPPAYAGAAPSAVAQPMPTTPTRETSWTFVFQPPVRRPRASQSSF
jgi:PAS domain S-box-containing protein